MGGASVVLLSVIYPCYHHYILQFKTRLDRVNFYSTFFLSQMTHFFLSSLMSENSDPKRKGALRCPHRKVSGQSTSGTHYRASRTKK